jgi:hypothetical protein
MRLVILGETGMLGHILCVRLYLCFPDTHTTIRKSIEDCGDDRLYGRPCYRSYCLSLHAQD